MITEVVEASEECSKDRHEKLFETLLETIPSSVLLIDRDMRIVLANRNFLQKSRRRRTEAIGRKLGEVLPAAIIEYMDISSRVRQVFENGRATRGERLVYRAPGIPMTIYYYSILPFSWRGHVENAVLLMEDVTEQVRLSEEVRRAERHLASVVESATDLVLSTDAEGRVVTWNTAAERLSG
jgi:PAS domain S-box-containing protein